MPLVRFPASLPRRLSPGRTFRSGRAAWRSRIASPRVVVGIVMPIVMHPVCRCSTSPSVASVRDELLIGGFACRTSFFYLECALGGGSVRVTGDGLVSGDGTIDRPTRHVRPYLRLDGLQVTPLSGQASFFVVRG